MQEDELWRQYRETGSLQAKEELILRYAPLVRSCARTFSRRVPSSIEYADLVSYGILGLLDAVGRYDPSYNRDFAVYARSRVTGAIIDGIRSEAAIPRSTYQKLKKVSRAEEELTSTLHRNPGHEETAAFLGLDTGQYDQMLGEIQSSRLLSLDDLVSRGEEEGGCSLLDILEDKGAPDPTTVMEENQLGTAVRRAIQGLPERYRIILKLHYFEDFTLREIAEVLSISESRASQMHRHALSQLRNSMNGRLALLSA